MTLPPSAKPDRIHWSVSPAERFRPPLADNLFDARTEFAQSMRHFSACQPIIPFLRHRAKTATVEQVLEHLQTEATRHPQGYRELAAIRYYLQTMLWECQTNWKTIHNGVTNYKTRLYLIRQSRRDSSPTCLVTFNYDTLLEDALPTVDARVENISDYVTGREYKVFKVHGSVHWGRRIHPLPLRELHALSDDQIVAQVIRLAPQIFEQKVVTNEYVLSGNPSVTKVDNQAIFPAIAIPVESKLEFECPQEHVDTLTSHLQHTTKILIIGWRATDAPFLELLKAHLPLHIKIMSVGGRSEEAEKIMERFNVVGIRRIHFSCSEWGFTDFILSGEAESFLAA
jgi:hypothetical protein